MVMPKVPYGASISSYNGYVLDAGVSSFPGIDYFQRTQFKPVEAGTIQDFTAASSYYRSYSDPNQFISKTGGFGWNSNGLQLPNADGTGFIPFTNAFGNVLTDAKQANALATLLNERAGGLLASYGIDPKTFNTAEGRQKFFNFLSKNSLVDKIGTNMTAPLRTSELINAGLNAAGLAANIGIGFGNYLNAKRALQLSEHQFNASYELMRRNYMNQAKSYNNDVYDKYAGRAYVGQLGSVARSIQRDAKSRYVDENMDSIRVENGKVRRSRG